MKRIGFIMIVAMMLSCIRVNAQEIHYYIDGKRVENFDGSQLVGKTIKRYVMNQVPNSPVVIHNIFTDSEWIRVTNRPLGKSIEPDIRIEGNMRYEKLSDDDVVNPLVLMDGEEYSGEISEIDPASVKCINVYKPGSEVALHYGEKGKNGVMEIFTKSFPEGITYLIDDSLVTKEKVNQLSPEKIKGVKVLKRGSADAIRMRAEGNVNNIILISTKKDGARIFVRSQPDMAKRNTSFRQNISIL